MPRGRKKLSAQTLDERIADTNAAIEAKKAEISALKELRKDLMAQKQKSEMSALYEVVKVSGKSPAEIMELMARV